MPFKFLPDIAIADIAFEASSDSPAGLLQECAAALTDVMVDPKSLKPTVQRKLSAEAEDLDRLLYDFLTELIVMKDVDSFLVSKADVELSADRKRISATLSGEPIDRERHILRNDAKAVTMHMFGVKHEGPEWKAIVVLDI